jgi:hypothetical protein
MAQFYVETTDVETTVDAEDWGVEWGLLIFWDSERRKVLGLKAETVKQISRQPPKDSQ